MYEVNINADPEHFLDWDKPLSEQHPEVMAKAAQAYGIPKEKFHDLLFARPKAPEDTAKLAQAGIPGIKYLDQGSRMPDVPSHLLEKRMDIQSRMDEIRSIPEEQHTKNLMDEYDDLAGKKDQINADIKAHQSATATRNYVVFNDKLIDILKKYGISAVAAPSVAQEIMSQGNGQPKNKGGSVALRTAYAIKRSSQ